MAKPEGAHGAGMAGEFSLGCNKFGVPGAPEVETSLRGRCLFRSGPCGAGGVSEGLQSLGRTAEGHFLPPLGVTFALAA